MAFLKTLFLHPPSFEGFDGGAGSRYQARREIRSFWYPTWLAQPAALVPGSRLIDAPPAGLTLEDIRPVASEYELAILHTSTPSFAHDVRVAETLKETNPGLRVGFVGAHYAIGYLLHPYVSLYTGRGCRSKCTFCLWPQTVGGHRYRTRSVEHVVAEIALGQRYCPQVR